MSPPLDDRTTFAVALSTGGLKKAAIGRVGDVPLPGCGLFCGPAGAVACTGNGEFIAFKILAKEVYGWLEFKMRATEAAQKAMTLFDKSIDIGLIVLTNNEFAAKSRKGMAWGILSTVNSCAIWVYFGYLPNYPPKLRQIAVMFGVLSLYQK